MGMYPSGTMRRYAPFSFGVFGLAASLFALTLGAACGGSDAEPSPFPTETRGAGEAAVTAVPTRTGEAAPPARKQYTAPPAMQIDPARQYTATIVTEVGDIEVELFADRAPDTVNNFVFLARDGYYDGITFHRVIADFMAQAGDPTGTGRGGPGYTIADEFHPELRHGVGVLSMANTGVSDSGGAQFFITFVPTPFLDGLDVDGAPKACGNPGVSCHAVFGRVTGGQDAVGRIRLRDPARDPDPGTRIETIRITEE